MKNKKKNIDKKKIIKIISFIAVISWSVKSALSKKSPKQTTAEQELAVATCSTQFKESNWFSNRLEYLVPNFWIIDPFSQKWGSA